MPPQGRRHPTDHVVRRAGPGTDMSCIRTVNVNSVTMSTSSLKVSDKMQGHKMHGRRELASYMVILTVLYHCNYRCHNYVPAVT